MISEELPELIGMSDRILIMKMVRSLRNLREAKLFLMHRLLNI